MTPPTATEAGSRLRLERGGITVAYLAQGLSYATVVTALPGIKARYDLDDDTVALMTLTVVLGAAAGSLVADRVAVRWGSRASVVLALGLQAVALLAIATPLPLPIAWTLYAVYGLGLGGMDAGGAMQGVIVQRRLGRSVMGSFFAASTGAGIVGALLMSAGGSTGLGVSLGLASAGLACAAVAAASVRILDPARERASLPGASRPPLPTAGLWVVGFVVFAAFTADSTVSTWSTLHLSDGLGASDAIAPLGYAVYAGFTLVTRLVVDMLVRRVGRIPVVVVTVAAGMAGLVLAGLLAQPWAALSGFALAGLGVGALVPLAYSAAGDLDPRRGDEIVARVNLFTYPGSLIGAVVPGLIAGGTGFGTAFLIAAGLLATVLALAPRLRESQDA